MHGTMTLTKPQIVPPIEKIRLDVESLVGWAYSEELPKAPPSSSQRNWHLIKFELHLAVPCLSPGLNVRQNSACFCCSAQWSLPPAECRRMFHI